MKHYVQWQFWRQMKRTAKKWGAKLYHVLLERVERLGKKITAPKLERERIYRKQEGMKKLPCEVRPYQHPKLTRAKCEYSSYHEWMER
jgi:hypothetical protein